MQEDPEFEKRIRQRMEELKFSPSATVWDNLEKEIKKDKSRRRPLIWFSFFLALGVGGFFYFSSNKENNNHKNKIDINTSSKQDAVSNPSAKTQTATANDEKSTLTEKKNDQQNIKSSTSSVNDQANTIFKQNTNGVAKKDIQQNKKTIYKHVDTAPEDFATVNKLSKNKKGTGKINQQKNDATNDIIKDEIVDDQLAANKDTHNYLNDSAKTNRNELDKVGSVIDQSDSSKQKTVANNKTDTKVDKTDPKKDLAKKDKKQNNKKSWEFGLTGGAGVSTIKENLFDNSIPQAAPNAYNRSFSLAAAPAPPMYNAPSSVKSGFSFSAGVFAQKPLSKRIGLSVGLNYHYATTKIQTTAYGYFASSAVQHDYINHYHMLELPVMVSYRLNKSKHLPLFLEGGFSLAELISSDAMHYNSVTGTYYQDNNLFNKTQLNAATALMIGFHAGRKLYFQVGPQLQYGITNLLTADAGGSQHLFFGGFKIVFIPNKK
ncbi:MAG: PorT family protein [Bacteroidetes bacterium]|nr:PorT family protein [Bacteroidota bacterium]